MRRHRPLWLIAAVVLIGLWAWTQPSDNGALRAPEAPPTATSPRDRGPPAAPTSTSSAHPSSRYPAFLPREAHAVLDDLARGGPYDHRQDGGVFQNRERRLPSQPRGYYREYTVPTPGSGDRGPRRIITGGRPPFEYWYSDDHYRSFRRFDLAPGASR